MLTHGNKMFPFSAAYVNFATSGKFRKASDTGVTGRCGNFLEMFECISGKVNF